MEEDFSEGGGSMQSLARNEFSPKLVHLEDEDYSEEGYYGVDSEGFDHSRGGVAYPDEGEGDDDAYYERISLSELVDQCVIPTLSQTVHTVYPLLALCLISRAVNIFCVKGLCAN